MLDATILVAVNMGRRNASVVPSESNSSAMWILTPQDGDSALQSRPWWQDYRVQAAALMAVTAGLVIAFV